MQDSAGASSSAARLLILLALGLVALVACQRQKALDPQSADAWSRVIVGHTSGVVPRRTQVRVLFAGDVGTGQPAASLLAFTPAIDGDLAFRGPRELVFTPKRPLEPGREYRVTLKAAGLAGIPPGIAPYSFSFRAQTPQFDLVSGDLATDPSDDRRMMLTSRLVTADAEDGAQIERMLQARLDAAPVTATWSHSGDGREHVFTLAGLERAAAPRKLVLALDGKPIGASGAVNREVDLPALSTFAVLAATPADEGGRREIRLVFSDSLDQQQDLKGLLQLSAGKFTTRIEANRITLYPDENLTGDVTVTVEPGLRNARGQKLEAQSVWQLTLVSEKPQLRFVGEGVILPEGPRLTVPFEVINARSLRVTATRVFPENIPQFLQVNSLPGNNELGRVGRYLWRRTVALNAPRTGRWERYELDVTELVRRYPGSLFQLALQLTPADSAYACAGAPDVPPAAADADLPRDQEDGDTWMASSWDFSEDWFGVAQNEDGEYDYQARWNERRDPCKAAYFVYNPDATRAERNVLASNLGLLAKADTRGQLLITATDLRTAKPAAGVSLSVRNFQWQVIASGATDRDGMARIEPEGTPFLLIAGAGADRGYLKLNSGKALPVSHFDVGGETVDRGLKGAIYGERGVWRPGDPLPLTFVVRDRDGALPPNHPATMELLDPRGRSTQTVVNANPVDGFYRFDLRTAADAPTGNWTAKVSLGGATFRKTLKIETVMPNRLKIDLDLPQDVLGAGMPLRGGIAAEWLTGASAAGLKADVNLQLRPQVTRFQRFTDYVFDDPAREFRTEPEEIFAGELDAAGRARFDKPLELAMQPPGMLAANLTTRVFERGGAFSIHNDSRSYAPYARFVGLKLPEGDVARGMLRTDEDHVVQIGSLTAQGQPVALRNLRVTLYKVEWRWWWDRSEESLADYVARQASARVSEERISTDAEGRGSWKLRINYPQWGRYLLRVCDEEGGHCAGKTFYIDWPAWAGREREQSGPAATMLSLTADKAEYRVGERAVIQLPESSQGRALVTVENGSGILDARWVMPAEGNTRVSIPVTAAMTPNAYVSVTLVQPHEGKTNDRPIRLYGVVPLLVSDAATHLKPVLQAADEWRPESKVSVKVSEAQGRPMTYTLAVVDEGLLSLTGFRTPDLHQEFFRREALGVRTWDLFDEVIGAYGVNLERLLALGGSDAVAEDAAKQPQSRFPPVAQLLGPFQLKAGQVQEQQVQLPRYVGAVRVMLVAGSNAAKPAAFGSAEKSVYVRQPLMILPTLPRVVGPGEEIAVPVSVFAMNDSVRDVQLSMQPDGMFEVVGSSSTALHFQRTGDQLGLLRLKAGSRLGASTVKFAAVSGEHRAAAEIHIEVRSPNPPSTRLTTQLIEAGGSWSTPVRLHGLPGTNHVTLEVSALPPLNLEERLRYLITYPHGCLEQVVSAVFPQLFLGSLVKLDAARSGEIEDNVRAGIERLRSFQLGNGGFSYWPGGSSGFASGPLSGYQSWSTTWAGHFLVEAERLGYSVPSSMRAGLLRNLREVAQGWQPGAATSAMDQAYRLYVLARAGQPEVGAMNRLRELRDLGTVERWLLASAYQLAGLADAARSLAGGDPLAARATGNADYTFGSVLRDHAVVLQALVITGQLDRALPVIRAISDELATDRWQSTQSVAWSLLAMSQLAGAQQAGPFTFEQTLGANTTRVSSDSAVYQATLGGLAQDGQTLRVANTSKGPLFATLAVRGTPPAGEEGAIQSGLALRVNYSGAQGQPVDVARLPQGTDVIVDLAVENLTRLPIDHIALTQIVPSGWEIHNDRLAGDDMTGERAGAPRSGVDGTRAATAPRTDHVDIRDDRVMQYFRLLPGETIRFQTRINAAYSGRYYLPGVQVEAMYDASKQARSAGRWTEVVAP
ncbi:MAG: MG2 domain-containing protein [Steroidobacteraceae bacterium]